jgi:hypothetical protein
MFALTSEKRSRLEVPGQILQEGFDEHKNTAHHIHHPDMPLLVSPFKSTGTPDAV